MKRVLDIIKHNGTFVTINNIKVANQDEIKAGTLLQIKSKVGNTLLLFEVRNPEKKYAISTEVVEESLKEKTK